MNMKSFLRTNAVPDQRFTRFNEFDADRFDYTVQIQKPNGEIVTLRNPGEAKDGSLMDKKHSVPTEAKLMAAGTAGWDWIAKKQHSVGIDIDTDHKHADGLNAATFGTAQEAALRVPWLEVRRSSGGRGLHVFPKFTRPVDVSCRAEASALARAVLTVASREVGFDFKAVKDCAGSNFWIYKADAAPNAYEVIKEATAALDPNDLPPGWREVKTASKSKIRFAPSTVELSPEHLEIEKQIQAMKYSMIYVPGLGCYHIHTHALQEAHQKYGYRGLFVTVSEGTDPGQPNGYMFPLPGGAFLVKRFGNSKEHQSWLDGPNGQYAFLNVEVPFKKAIQHFSNNKTTRGYAITRNNLASMLKAIGVELDIPAVLEGRMFFIKHSKDDAQICVDRLETDGQIENWTLTSETLQRSFAIPSPSEAFAHADVVRVSDVVRAVSLSLPTSLCTNLTNWWIGTTE